MLLLRRREMIRNQYDRKYQAKLKAAKQDFYGKVGKFCFICSRADKLKCHRINFQFHIPIADLRMTQLVVEKIEDYVRLCFQCHYGVHWLHNNFSLSWEEIINLRREGLVLRPGS